MIDRTDPTNTRGDDVDYATTIEHADCCIVGGGPAGAVLALLLARQGVAVTLLEALGDFNRDFRGDALQPAALDVIGQMGLADRLLAVALARIPVFPIHTLSESLPLNDVSRLRTPYPFMTIVSQVRFLDLIVAEAQRCPSFRLVMGATDLAVPGLRPSVRATRDTENQPPR